MKTTFQKFSKNLRRNRRLEGADKRFTFYSAPPKHILLVDGKQVDVIEVDSNESLSIVVDGDYAYEDVGVCEPLHFDLYKKII